MTGFLARRTLPFLPNWNTLLFSQACSLYSTCLTCFTNSREEQVVPSSQWNRSEYETGCSTSSTSLSNKKYLSLSPLQPFNVDFKEFHLELMDSELWNATSGISQRWEATNTNLISENSLTEISREEREKDCSSTKEENYVDFDEIEDMRYQRRLFYKLEKDSREYEECSFRFYKKKVSKKKGEKLVEEKTEKVKTEKKGQSIGNGTVKSDFRDSKTSSKKNESRGDTFYSSLVYSIAPVREIKKLRSPTYNQLTGPYHEPFCLDIFVSKGSVRACIIHRVTSKVVVVTHSISKDMKFDLVSRKDSKTCATVGSILARRAIAEDIHNVIYTPRKGERIEGKLQIVLQSIISHGVDVKVKLKQKRNPHPYETSENKCQNSL